MWAFKFRNKNSFVAVNKYMEYVQIDEKASGTIPLVVTNTELELNSKLSMFKNMLCWDIVPVIISFNEWEL